MAGANEVQFGFVNSLSLWEESGRANTMGHEMLRFKDRKNTNFVLSPTNEESVVNMVKIELLLTKIYQFIFTK